MTQDNRSSNSGDNTGERTSSRQRRTRLSTRPSTSETAPRTARTSRCLKKRSSPSPTTHPRSPTHCAGPDPSKGVRAGLAGAGSGGKSPYRPTVRVLVKRRVRDGAFELLGLLLVLQNNDLRVPKAGGQAAVERVLDAFPDVLMEAGRFRRVKLLVLPSSFSHFHLSSLPRLRRISSTYPLEPFHRGRESETSLHLRIIGRIRPGGFR